MVLKPKDAAEYIAKEAKHVKIVQENISKLGDILVGEIESEKLSTNNFSQTDVHPSSDEPWAIDWIFLVDTLNFCFWHNENDDGWQVDGKTGYFALCAAINRAQKDKVDILNPNYYSVIKEEELKKILKSDTKVECPLITERLKCLHEVGNVLVEKFEGSFENVVKKADNSAVKLLGLILENFQSFRDEAEYNNEKVGLYKRAQILIGDIWACFKNKGIGHFKDIDEITAFADYRVPQTLLWYGILEYDDDLLKKLKNNELLKNGSEEEVEIRGCTLQAVELLNKYVGEKLEPGKINSVMIDHFLWDFRRKHADEIVEKGLPFHKTLSIYY